MNVLSVKQPWAWALVAGFKPVENRKWRTPYRGPLLIHACKAADPAGFRFLDELGLYAQRPMARGAIVGRVELVDCLPLERAPSTIWTFGPWCWFVRNAVEFEEPIPAKGRLGLWDFSHQEGDVTDAKAARSGG